MVDVVVIRERSSPLSSASGPPPIVVGGQQSHPCGSRFLWSSAVGRVSGVPPAGRSSDILRTRTWRTSRRGRAERRQERSQRGRLGRARAADLRFSRSVFFFSRSFRQRLTDLEPRPIALDPNQSGVKGKSKESGSIRHERRPGSGRQRSRRRRRRSRDAVPRELRARGRSRPEPLRAALWVRCRPDAQIPLELNFGVAGALRQRAWSDADVRSCDRRGTERCIRTARGARPSSSARPPILSGSAFCRSRLHPLRWWERDPTAGPRLRKVRRPRAPPQRGRNAVHARSAIRRASLVTQTRLTASVHFPRPRHASDEPRPKKFARKRPRGVCGSRSRTSLARTGGVAAARSVR